MTARHRSMSIACKRPGNIDAREARCSRPGRYGIVERVRSNTKEDLLPSAICRGPFPFYCGLSIVIQLQQEPSAANTAHGHDIEQAAQQTWTEIP